MMSRVLKHVLIAIVGLSLVAVSAPAFSADVTGKTSTQTLPTQTNTQTSPLPSNTRTVPLPSTTRKYQQVDKPPVKTLDIPDWDLVGQLRNLGFGYRKVGLKRKKVFNGLHFDLALMNVGKLYGARDVPVRITVKNITNNTLIAEKNEIIQNQNIRHDMWGLTPRLWIQFSLGSQTASRVNDLKLIVDIDPRNTFGEAQNDRRNNRCVVTW